MRIDVDTLKRLRLGRGENQEELAARVGITEEAYRRIEIGTTAEPRPRTIKAIADALDVTVDQLLVRDGRVPA